MRCFLGRGRGPPRMRMTLVRLFCDDAPEFVPTSVALVGRPNTGKVLCHLSAAL